MSFPKTTTANPRRSAARAEHASSTMVEYWDALKRIKSSISKHYPQLPISRPDLRDFWKSLDRKTKDNMKNESAARTLGKRIANQYAAWISAGRASTEPAYLGEIALPPNGSPQNPTEFLQGLADKSRRAVNPKVGLFQSLESSILQVMTQYPEHRQRLMPTLTYVSDVVSQESAAVCTDRMHETDEV